MGDLTNAITTMPEAASLHGRFPLTGQLRIQETLTGREMQVLRLMADGLSTKEIGVTLNITFKTAASHRSHILAKMGVHETVTAVRMAIRGGIIVA